MSGVKYADILAKTFHREILHLLLTQLYLLDSYTFASESSCIENMNKIALNVLKVQSAEMHAECHITFIVFNIN